MARLQTLVAYSGQTPTRKLGALQSASPAISLAPRQTLARARVGASGQSTHPGKSFLGLANSPRLLSKPFFGHNDGRTGHNTTATGHNKPFIGSNNTVREHNDGRTGHNTTSTGHNKPFIGSNDAVREHNTTVTGPNNASTGHNKRFTGSNNTARGHNTTASQPNKPFIGANKSFIGLIKWFVNAHNPFKKASLQQKLPKRGKLDVFCPVGGFETYFYENCLFRFRLSCRRPQYLLGRPQLPTRTGGPRLRALPDPFAR
ncbi:MAG: hypothetical protein WCO56_05805 [Verrucomicrobiota bacterium]